MNVTQTVLNAITVVQLVVGISTSTVWNGVSAETGLQVSKAEDISIGDYVRWACADDAPITIATAQAQRIYKTTPIRHELAICKTVNKDGDIFLVCRTATFNGVAKGLAERDAVHNAIKHCRDNATQE